MLFCYSQNSHFFTLKRRKIQHQNKIGNTVGTETKKEKMGLHHSVTRATEFRETISTIIIHKGILPSSCTPQFKSFKFKPHNRFYGTNFSKSHNFYVPQFPTCRWAIRKDCNRELRYRKHF